MPRRFDASKFGLDHLKATAEKCKNWGRWGPDDEVGTLNFITPESIAGAARLIRRGKVFSLGLNFDRKGPQRGLWGNRYNPIHTMLATGTDAVSGNQDAGKLRYADDSVSMPLQCGTQWDALGHITPELPRAPRSAPRASASAAGPPDRSSASAAPIVSSMFVPVSRSATGKTLMRSISARCRSSAATAAPAQRSSSAASSDGNTSTSLVSEKGPDPCAGASAARVLWMAVTGSRPADRVRLPRGVSEMAAVCDVCGKGPGFGMSVSHSHRRTHRRWNPNIQTVRTRIDGGNRQRLNVCTSCLKAGKVARA